jgi:hypothetical protein
MSGGATTTGAMSGTGTTGTDSASRAASSTAR